MKILRNRFCRPGLGLQWATFIWMLALGVATAATAADDVRLPTLKTKFGTYTNVLVTGKTGTDIFIQHERGMGNIKLADIQDDAALRALGLLTPPDKGGMTPPAATSPVATNAPSPTATPAARPTASRLDFYRMELEKLHLPFALLVASLALAFVFYLFSCYCLKLICEKAGSEPDALIWLPLFQMIPALRAAGMSGWWLLVWLTPVLNAVNSTGLRTLDLALAILTLVASFGVQIAWCFKITAARGQPVWVAILLLLPGVNLVAFLYLAFSEAKEDALE